MIVVAVAVVGASIYLIAQWWNWRDEARHRNAAERRIAALRPLSDEWMPRNVLAREDDR